MFLYPTETTTKRFITLTFKAKSSDVPDRGAVINIDNVCAFWEEPDNCCSVLFINGEEIDFRESFKDICRMLAKAEAVEAK